LIQPKLYTQARIYADLGLRECYAARPHSDPAADDGLRAQPDLASNRLGERSGARVGPARPVVVGPTKVSQQAVSQRLGSFPAELFHRVLIDLLPQLQRGWQDRQRPLSKAMAWALERFPDVVVLDGSTLDALMRKVGLLRDSEGPVLAGRIAALVSAASQLPRQIWYEEDSQAHDQTFWERAVASLPKGVLLLFDLGFTNYDWFDKLSLSNIWFVTRAKANAVYQVQYRLHNSPHWHDWVVRLGQGATECATLLWLIEIQVGGHWFRI